MRTRHIRNLKHEKHARAIGNKARSLAFLIKRGYPVPATWVCSWDAFVQFRRGDAALAAAVKAELAGFIQPRTAYAVRSSANVEDDQQHSFAGQFKSILNVTGIEDVLAAIRSIWESTSAPAVQTYAKKTGVDPASLKMAVIIQEMVPPKFSGVSFSRNPITGMDETVVEAVMGSSDALLQEGVTPQRWIHKWGEWITLPAQESLPRDIIQEVVTRTRDIARIYGKPVDLEWAYDGNALYWVQLREITSLKNLNVYSNHIAREVLPGIIKPLVWSINVPMVNSAWKQFLTELIGDIDLDAGALAKPFYYRAYFNMGVIGSIFTALGLPPETIELLMGIYREGGEKPSFRLTPKMLLRLPRIARFTIEKIRYSRKFPALFTQMKERYRAFCSAPLERLSEEELMQQIDRLFLLSQQTAYYNIVVQLLMGFYNMLLKWQLKKLRVDFTCFDLTEDMEELKEFDPAIRILVMNQQFRQLTDDSKERISRCSHDEFCRLPGIAHLQQELNRFLERFGHLSDSGNDFSAAPWRENPEVILRMITASQQTENKSARNICYEELRMSRLRRLLFSPIYHKARAFRLCREEVSFLYTFGYGLFRTCFLALADRWTAKGFLAERDDIFYLCLDEIKAVINKGHMEPAYADAVIARKREIQESRDITLPSTIYGDQPPPLMNHSGSRLKGTPTSRGYYRGAVKVVRGIKDFAKVEPGSVLVIPYSDVGWTPLFTRAGALIAESGGILSHSSIIAREYNIPAVVSVSGACQLKDNTLVSVDGYLGEIVIHEP
jgi:phosphohistidine swiveling domain-containing protein